MRQLHEISRIHTTDPFFVCGGNPDGSGGGVIGSCTSFHEAQILQARAIRESYTHVKIMTWDEMMSLDQFIPDGSEN